MRAKVRFHPEFAEAIADGINMITIVGGVTTKEVAVDIDDQPFWITLTPAVITELLPWHALAQNQLLDEQSQFWFHAHREGEPGYVLELTSEELGVLCMVADKIIAGARGDLVPDLSGEIEVTRDEPTGPLSGQSDTGSASGFPLPFDH